ncbi:glutathione S-transferase [Violaceomyces palustris]|uniref:Glutathione S-transferase n=1 Tax=Violaceomyces palustris TaxID=1673888 RepID=A0ACD0NUY1_9BASI|nr:glutathione S-transferase [Violaceomyces palustris]
MSAPDVQIHAVATGKAAELVKAHSKPSPNGLIFYSGWFCPYVARVWIALEEKGVEYEYREINPYKKEESFLKINPKGLVPAIERKGFALYESLVLLEYLEEAFPDSAKIFPESAEERAISRMRIDMVSKKVIPAFFRTMISQTEEEQRQARKSFTEALKEFATYLSEEKPFVGGEKLDAVDISLAPWLSRLYIIEENRGGPITAEETSERFLRYVKDVTQRESVQNVFSDKAQYKQIYQRYLRNEAQSEAAKAVRAGRPIP